MVFFPKHRILSFLWLSWRARSVVVDNKAVQLPDLAPISFLEQSLKLQPGVSHRIEADEAARLSPVDYEYYRFSSKNSLPLHDLILYDRNLDPLDLRDPQVVLQARLGGDSANVGPCIDGATETRCTLEQGQSIVLKLAPGRPVGAYGFTVENTSVALDFDMAGSSDGLTWKNLSVKSQVEPPSLHPGGSAATALLMGPYKLMDLTAKKGEVSTAVASDSVWAKVMHPVKVSEVAFTTTVSTTSTQPPLPFSEAVSTSEETSGAAAQKVADAVMKASESSQVPLPEELASAAAAGAAAKDRPGKVSPEAIAEVAKGSGLSTPMLQRVKMALTEVDCKYYGVIMTMWNSASLGKDGNNIAQKVSQVVAASAAAGFSVDQQAQAGANAAIAGMASLTTQGPSSIISEVLEAARDVGLALEKQTKMAAVLETQSYQEQAALLMLLKSAMLAFTTSPSPELATGTFNASAAKMIGEAVAEALENVKVDPQKKLQVISAAAAAGESAAAHSSTTTSFDGVKLVVDAAKDAGVQDPDKLKKVEEEAQVMSPDEQKAAARSLEAASDTSNSTVAKAVKPHEASSLAFTTSKSPAETVEKVSEVVKAAAASGMTEDQQAEVAATAVIAATHPEDPTLKETGQAAGIQEPGLAKLVKAAKALGMSTEQQDALITSVSASGGDATVVDAIVRTMASAAMAR